MWIFWEFLDIVGGNGNGWGSGDRELGKGQYLLDLLREGREE
jgi:hypothetical protein